MSSVRKELSRVLMSFLLSLVRGSLREGKNVGIRGNLYTRLLLSSTTTHEKKSLDVRTSTPTDLSTTKWNMPELTKRLGSRLFQSLLQSSLKEYDGVLT